MAVEDSGEKFNAEGEYGLKHGPIERRSCTDVLFLLLFIGFWVGMWAVSINAYTKGDPTRLTHLYDSNGTACGTSYQSEYPYLYLPSTLDVTKGYCVSACPKSVADSNTQCNPSVCSASDLLPGYESKVVYGRVCAPINMTSAINDNLDTESLTNWLGDLHNSWEVVIIIAAIALVTAFAFMILIYYCAGVIAWLCILGVVASLAAIGYFCIYRARLINNGDIVGSSTNANVLTALSYVFYGLSGVSVLLVLCMFNRIRLAIAIMKAAALFIGDVKSTLLVPPCMFLASAAFYTYWIITTLYIVSSGDVRKSSTSVFSTVELDRSTQKSFIYFIFGLLWSNSFLVALNHFIIASACAIWYFSPWEPTQSAFKVSDRPVSKSVYRAFRYHLGSLAFGSLIIAIVQAVRLTLAYVQKQMKGKTANNKCVKVAFCMVDCCLACFERFLKFLSKNAYIQIAITGKKFCAAAKDAFLLIVRNAARFAAVNAIGSAFMFLGAALISIFPTLIGYIILTSASKYQDLLTSPIFPAVVGFTFAFVIARCFMSVYGMAADTILQCFAIDEEMNEHKGKTGGSSAQHAPEVLRTFLASHGGDEKGCCR
eukprot:GILJ01000743.1.p1 GENE.GILJ01000743.1~~GILJ01000743.1.p1  ORF type:complete len:610 (-),score=97.51 GILJ01000743.1:91-1884(-)